MTAMIKQNSGKIFVAGFFAGVLTLAVMAFTREQPRETSVREILLLATQIEFRLAGQPETRNPPLLLKKGAPVRLIIRNDEPGAVLHCFTIGGLNVKTTRDLATGESEALNFTPTKKGVFAYACLMHPMMAGKVIVK